MPDDDGKQPGDPAKAASAILTALDAAEAELSYWESVNRSTTFD